MEDHIYCNLKSIIKDYWQKVDLEQRYTPNRYDVPIIECPVIESLKADIGNCKTNLNKNLLLKRRLCKEMNRGVKNEDINFWIIRKWGGISLEKTDANQARIEAFFKLLKKSHQCGQSTIASFSKVASFANPLSFFVYDSRVAYSLNWLLRKSGATNGFFPIPQGQSRLAKHCMLQKVLDEEHRTKMEARNAYFKYCELVKRLYKDICPGGKEPYRLEMLLFQIAPVEIYNEFESEFHGTVFFRSSSTPPVIRPTSNQNAVFQNCRIKSRCADYGEVRVIDGNELYIFVGHISKQVYCELLYKKNEQNEYPIQDQLLTEGFELKGGNNPYLVRYFPGDQAEAVRQVFDQVLDRLPS